jgi:hypothetical protein
MTLLHTKFHGILPSGSKVISEGLTNRHTDRQTGDLISLLSFFESRLITAEIQQYHQKVQETQANSC